MTPEMEKPETADFVLRTEGGYASMVKGATGVALDTQGRPAGRWTITSEARPPHTWSDPAGVTVGIRIDTEDGRVFLKRTPRYNAVCHLLPYTQRRRPEERSGALAAMSEERI